MLYILGSYIPIIFFCALLFYILEKPMMKLGHKLSN